MSPTARGSMTQVGVPRTGARLLWRRPIFLVLFASLHKSTAKIRAPNSKHVPFVFSPANKILRAKGVIVLGAPLHERTFKEIVLRLCLQTTNQKSYLRIRIYLVIDVSLCSNVRMNLASPSSNKQFWKRTFYSLQEVEEDGKKKKSLYQLCSGRQKEFGETVIKRMNVFFFFFLHPLLIFNWRRRYNSELFVDLFAELEYIFPESLSLDAIRIVPGISSFPVRKNRLALGSAHF
ncbi:hypothetical protein CEXT_472831 [Caerostris extrusa]|uniref:Uncharacterized protein n=1 Tax=Caerostris extrusa TaxID=172846 RepID=A0AAV4XBP3_CAEEX|nr:hypothetical protein CEXT_472831 [Caerostris extrusa]